MSQAIDSWITSTLGTVLIRSDERVDPLRIFDKNIFYIGLEHIESNTGHLLDNVMNSAEELKSTKNIFYPGEILYGKLRPYLNKVYFAKENGICSTDIWVFRTTGVIDPDYAFYYLRSPFVLQRVSQLTTGANLPRVGTAAFDKIPIPLPSLPEQRRIASILREADEIRRLRKQANEKAQEIVQALFYDMFGDPATNPKGWRTERLGDLIAFTTSGPRNWAMYYTPEGSAKFIRVQNLTNHKLNFDDIVFITPPNTIEAKRSKVAPKDILFSITGVVGLVAVVPEDIGDAYVSQHVAIVRLKPDLDPHFVAAFLANKAGGQAQIGTQQYGQTKPGFGLNDIRSINILVPPYSLQKQFTEKLADTNMLEIMQNQSYSYMDALYQSLLAQAFTGELTAAWRERHADELAQAARERDDLLQRLHMIPIMQQGITLPRQAEEATQRTELTEELDEKQQNLFTIVYQQPDVYFAASRLHNDISNEVFDQALIEYIKDCSLDEIRRELHFLATSGLLKELSLLADEEPGIMHFITVYRALTNDDDSKKQDKAALPLEPQEVIS